MSNEQVYAAGLLSRALDPATQPPEIRFFLQAESDLLDDIVVEGMSMIDVGYGTGRHLTSLRNRLRTGVGVDYEDAYVVDARRRGGACRLHFVTGDATCVPIGCSLISPSAPAGTPHSRRNVSGTHPASGNPRLLEYCVLRSALRVARRRTTANIAVDE